jgi:hypothetical protein
VRARDTAPVEYANTIANKASCLSSLPDDPERPESGNPRNLAMARAYYEEARDLFVRHGEPEKARIVTEAAVALARESAPER